MDEVNDALLRVSATESTVLKEDFNRGGVEDTRLEAKAKAPKIPRPRPRTAFPRTDTLEAKDRNARGQGPRTQAQVLSEKKKVFTKIFQAISKKKKNLHEITFSKKFFKRSTKF